MGFLRSSMQGSADVYITNILVSFVAIAFIGLDTLQFDNILNIGKFASITIYLIVGSEIVRWLTNKCFLKLEATNRANLRTNVKKPTPMGYIKSICKLTTLLLGFVLAYAALCVLMGAPLQTQHEQTMVLATMLTSLTILPMAIYLGPSGMLQYLFYDTVDLSTRNEIALLEYLQQNAVAALIGAWGGSAVSPLDWDRAWQAYPIPNMIGGLVGLAASNAYTLLITGLTAFDINKKNVGKGKKNL